MDARRAENSTNVRFSEQGRPLAPLPPPPPLAPAWLRALFAAGGVAAPGLTARAAAHLFCLPPRRRRGRRSAAPLGEPFTVRGAGQRLQAWQSGSGPAVLLVHGWGGRGAQLAPLVAPIVRAGCTAVVFDAPAHGQSTGRTTAGVLFAEALAAVAARVGARAAVGHSLGAAALGWAMGHGLRLDAAVMVSPPRGITPFLRRACDALALSPAVEAGMQARFRRRFGITTDEFDPCLRAGEGTRHLLVVHDEGDGEVPWAEGAAVARAWPGAALETTRGLGHTAILRDAAVAARIAGFLGQHLPRCPGCGRLAVTAVEGRLACEGCALERELMRWS
jgi:hypothetical protein